jgi:hypothetical protein
VVVGGSVTIQHCSVKNAAAAIALSFLQVSSGKTTVANLSLHSLRFDTHPAFHILPGGSLVATALVADSVQLGNEALLDCAAITPRCSERWRLVVGAASELHI